MNSPSETHIKCQLTKIYQFWGSSTYTKNKWFFVKPNFIHFLQEIKDYITGLENIVKNKAKETLFFYFK